MENHLRRAALFTGLSFSLILPSMILHNLLSGLLRIEEPFFFLLTLLLALVFPFALAYLSVISMIIFIKKLPGFKRK